MQWNPYALPVLVAALAVTGAGAFILKQRRRTAAATEFLVMIATMAIIAYAYVIELSLTSLDAQLVMLGVRYVGVCSISAAQLVFALKWGGHHGWQTPGRLAALLGPPAIVLALAWTNEWHHWIGSSSTLVQRDGFVMRHAETHIGLWLFVVHAYGCLMMSTGIYLRAIYASPLHRSQGLILLVATVIPWVANALFLGGRSPDPDLDMSSIGYAGASIVWAFGLSRTRFLDLAPIARGQVFDGLADAVVVVGLGGRVIDWNPAAAQLFGRRIEDGIGLAVADLVGDEAAASLIGGQRALELPLLGRILSLDAAPLRGGDHALATILTLRDVSEQRRLGAAREEALRLAESVARTRSEFLARMSHEVRSPLHAIAGAADLLVGAELADPAGRYAAAVASSSRALLAVVDDLLDFSRLDADRMPVEPIDLDATAAMREVVVLFAGAADRKGLALAVDGDAELPVRADPNRLRQVLVNLVGNALKFTDRGSITLRARSSGSSVRIEVVDTGVGIPAHALERIFEPFVQAASIAGVSPSGTGLGLAISRRLVTLMGGELRVESRVGQGSVLWLTLPRATGIAARREGPSRAGGAARRGRVLVVDDADVNRFITGALLEREGCDVDLAEGAEQALALLASRAYALVLTDLRMPGIDGFELAARIRSAEHHCDTPVVALSADVYVGAELRARGEGMADWLSKPIDPGRLREVLDRLAPPLGAPTPVIADAPPMNIDELLGSRPELHARIMSAFRARTPLDLASLEAAVREERWAEARDTAHALYGAASMVGAIELARLCRVLSSEETSHPDAQVALRALGTAYTALVMRAPARAAEISA